MPAFLNFGIEFAMSLLVFSLLAKWYVAPHLRALPFRHALLILLSPFLLRHLGLMSLAPGVVEPAVTQSRFALYQAYGDFIAFLLALTAFTLVRFGSRRAIAVVWIFNLFGTIEFVHSMIRGTLSGTGGGIGAFWYIPVAYVPLGLVVHCLIFTLLIKRSAEYTHGVASSGVSQ